MRGFDRPVKTSLMEFAYQSLAGNWTGRREREAVSLFAFRHLLRQVRAGSSLHDAAQITIEFPVPQVTVGGKAQVCKDLVLWPSPAMTCWDAEGSPSVAPAAVLEWKFGQSCVHEPDVRWLQRFTSVYSDCIGYAISANRPGREFLLRCDRVELGQVERAWLEV